MRGFSPRMQTPHPYSLREATLSHKGRGDRMHADIFVMPGLVPGINAYSVRE